MNLPFKLLFGMTSNSSMYEFQSFTFTNAGAIGRTGPTLAQCRSAYKTAWVNDSSLFNVVSGIQRWTVPQTGRYRITAYGAQGGSTIGKGVSTGGYGAIMAGAFNLTGGEVIRILVGQDGNYPDQSYTLVGNGGGGSFVTRHPHNIVSSILVIAGGGGGSHGPANGQNTASAAGLTTTQGGKGLTNTFAASVNGQGGKSANNVNGGGGAGRNGTSGNGVIQGGHGISCSYGNGGGGFYSTGGGNCNGVGANLAGRGFLQGGFGGEADTTRKGVVGGFGGGGGVGHRASGGGGYSGGGGNADDGGNGAGGGGGGSYNSGMNQSNQSGVGTSHGYIKITFLR